MFKQYICNTFLDILNVNPSVYVDIIQVNIKDRHVLKIVTKTY